MRPEAPVRARRGKRYNVGMPTPSAQPLPDAPAGPRANLAERVYARLKSEMNDFLLVPGDRLSEAEIGTRLGVSRTPVRQALFRLRDEGFLEVEAKSGWYVKPLDFAKLDDFYDLRIILEMASATRLCNRAGDNSELDRLKSVWLVPVGERLSDAGAVGTLDEQFHTTLVSAAGNAEAARVHQDVTERIRVIRRLDFTRGDRIAATYAEHAKILRAIMQRKADLAPMLLRAHIEQSKIEVRKISLSTLYEARHGSR
jgi:DNA-binding GntR family transcriptional regulator